MRERRAGLFGVPPLSLSWPFSDEESFSRSPPPLALRPASSSCRCAGRQFPLLRHNHCSLSFSETSHPLLLSFCLAGLGLQSFADAPPFGIVGSEILEICGEPAVTRETQRLETATRHAAHELRRSIGRWWGLGALGPLQIILGPTSESLLQLDSGKCDGEIARRRGPENVPAGSQNAPSRSYNTIPLAPGHLGGLLPGYSWRLVVVTPL